MYLVIECEELNDQYECDADRKPVCLTCDYPDEYNRVGYEIYEVLDDNTFKLIKEYTQGGDTFVAVYGWEIETYPEGEEIPEVFEEWQEFSDTSQIPDRTLKDIIRGNHFHDSFELIKEDLNHRGAHGEIIDDYWVVIGNATQGFEDFDRGY